MKLPLNRPATEFAIYHLKEMDIDLYLATMALIRSGKMKEAVFMVLGALRIGGDELSKVEGNFEAFLTLQRYVTDMTEPLEGDLKKN